jgi:hypothetical protein
MPGDPRGLGGLGGSEQRVRRRDRFALGVRIGVAHASGETRTPQEHDEAMSLARAEHDRHVLEACRLAREQRHQSRARLGRNPARAPVGHDAPFVDRAEVRACGHVAVFERHARAERFQHAAPDLSLDRIEPEQGQVARAAPGRDAGRHVLNTTQRRAHRDRVQMGRPGGFERRAVAVLRMRQIAEPVEHEQHDPSRARDDQRPEW